MSSRAGSPPGAYGLLYNSALAFDLTPLTTLGRLVRPFFLCARNGRVRWSGFDFSRSASCVSRPALLILRSKPSVPADSRVTFFPKPKKVTKEGFALRLALLARGGRCVTKRLLLVIKVRPDFVFAAGLLH